MLEAMQAYGASAAQIEAVRARIESNRVAPLVDHSTFAVHADNFPVVVAFQALSTQWQYAGMAGQRMGFCYAGVSAWIDRFIQRRKRRAFMSDLQLMERAVLAADQEQRDKKERE